MSIDQFVESCNDSERTTLLSRLLREYCRPYPSGTAARPIPVQGDGGTVIGVFFPIVTDADEETEEFMAELDRRMASDGPYISADVVRRQLEAFGS